MVRPLPRRLQKMFTAPPQTIAPVQNAARDAGPYSSMFMNPLVESKATGSWQRGLPDVLLGIGTGLLTGNGWGEGIGRGLQYAVQLGQDRKQDERRDELLNMERQRFDWLMAKDQRDYDAGQQQAAARNAAIDALNVPDEVKAWMKAGGDYDPFPKAQGASSALGKLGEDLQAGRITQAQYDAAVAKENYIAPQQPLATNLVTLVGPDGKTTRSFDSRDPQVKALAAQGWTERQNSMFPAAPSGYAYTPEGLAPIPGGPADPANPNNIDADQRKTGSFATRLEAASGIIDQFETAGTDYWQSGLSSVPLVGNSLISEDRQQLEQAQRDFINAQLRRESGATIQDQEFENARQQYFPQPGDSEKVVEQKRRAREIAVENMKREAGPAARTNSPTSDIPPPPPGFTVTQ